MAFTAEMRPPDFVLFVVPGIADVRKGDHLDLLGQAMPPLVCIEISSAIFDISMIDDSLPEGPPGKRPPLVYHRLFTKWFVYNKIRFLYRHNEIRCQYEYLGLQKLARGCYCRFLRRLSTALPMNKITKKHCQYILEFPEFSATISFFSALPPYPVSQVFIIIAPHFLVRNSGRFR